MGEGIDRAIAAQALLDSDGDSNTRCSCGMSAEEEHYCKTLNRLRRASTGEVPE